MKGHKKRMHSKAKLSKVFEDVTDSALDDKVNEQTRKRTKAMSSNVLEKDAEPKQDNVSPSSSPPRKKLETDMSTEEMLDLDDLEINVEKETLLQVQPKTLHPSNHLI